MSGLRRLAVLDNRRRELETCGYCPKLCRAACPVSEAEASEALTPWGKMTLTWYEARGDLPRDRDLAKLAWGCSGCLACRERCEHRNPVVPTLEDARAAARARGLAPAGSERALAEFALRRQSLRNRVLGLRSVAHAKTALLIGCGYLAQRGDEAEHVFGAATALAGPLYVARGCCGLAARLGGDVDSARLERAALLAEVAGRELVVADAGCALELRSDGARTLAELGAAGLERFRRVDDLPERVRYHDPCRLSRGLGLQDEPRSILTRVLGRPPEEFERRGDGVACSGGGGFLPFTFRRAARAIARDRLDEHRRLGGGTIVTACSSSLAWFRAQGALVLDLATLMARSAQRD